MNTMLSHSYLIISYTLDIIIDLAIIQLSAATETYYYSNNYTINNSYYLINLSRRPTNNEHLNCCGPTNNHTRCNVALFVMRMKLLLISVLWEVQFWLVTEMFLCLFFTILLFCQLRFLWNPLYINRKTFKKL